MTRFLLPILLTLSLLGFVASYAMLARVSVQYNDLRVRQLTGHSADATTRQFMLMDRSVAQWQLSAGVCLLSSVLLAFWMTFRWYRNFQLAQRPGFDVITEEE